MGKKAREVRAVHPKKSIEKSTKKTKATSANAATPAPPKLDLDGVFTAKPAHTYGSQSRSSLLGSPLGASTHAVKSEELGANVMHDAYSQSGTAAASEAKAVQRAVVAKAKGNGGSVRAASSVTVAIQRSRHRTALRM
jgi:hypothetical protein